MELELILDELLAGKLDKRRIDGKLRYKGRPYNFKAYRITGPQNIIRIDITEEI